MTARNKKKSNQPKSSTPKTINKNGAKKTKKAVRRQEGLLKLQGSVGNQVTAKIIRDIQNAENAGLVIQNENLHLNPKTQHSERRSLQTELEQRFKQAGYETTVDIQSLVKALIMTADHRYEFASKNDLVEALFQSELLYRKQSGPHLGPRTLGKRPDFSSEVNRVKMQKGDARRHVISSSTLGWAIEKSLGGKGDGEKQKKLTAVQDFLTRQGTGIMETGKLERDLHSAARLAWQITHNHLGNLWLGNSQYNSVRGFIRTSLRAEQERLKRLVTQEGDAKTSITEIYNAIKIARGPGMQQPGATELWEGIAEDLKQVLQQSAKGADQIDPQEAITILQAFERSADLDLPQKSREALADNNVDGGQQYLTDIVEVYADLLLASETHDIFKQDGALDRFLKLDTGLQAEQKQAAVN